MGQDATCGYRHASVVVLFDEREQVISEELKHHADICSNKRSEWRLNRRKRGLITCAMWSLVLKMGYEFDDVSILWSHPLLCTFKKLDFITGRLPGNRGETK
jgi:hypothetical protein